MSTGGEGRFHEVVQPYTLFCEITWMGYDIDSSMKYQVSPWTSWSVRCRANILICMVVAAALGIAIMIANLLVLSVYLTSPKIRNSQAIFKTSIAVGDFMAGMIVLPNSIVFQYLMHISPHLMGDLIDKNGTDLVYRKPGGSFGSVVPQEFVTFVGFFATLSVFISIYTLIIASLDRFWAVFNPLKYRPENAKRYSNIGSAVVWGLGILFASNPLFWSRLRYKLVLGSLVTSGGEAGVIQVTILFAIPLIALCVANVATFRSAQRHAIDRGRLMSAASNARSKGKLEKRLSKTLCLMVGTFTACFFPSFFVILLAVFFYDLRFIIPERLDTVAVVMYHSTKYCTILLLFSNSLWNCFIYSARGEDFRKELKQLRVLRYFRSTTRAFRRSLKRLTTFPRSYFRRKSSVGTFEGTESSISTTLPSVSSGYNSNDNIQTYRKKSRDPTTPSMYFSTRKTSEDNEREEFASVDSTLGSFTIEGGSDRLFVSVMEHIDEELS